MDGQAEQATGPHPAARLRETITRLPSYVRLTRALLAHRRLGRGRKAGLLAGLAYLLSPIDLVPGFIPVLGQLDDLAAILLALRFALRGLPGSAADRLLADSGLSRELLARDLDNVRVGGGWATRSALRIGVRTTTIGLRTAARGAEAGLNAARSGIRGVARLRRGAPGP